MDVEKGTQYGTCILVCKLRDSTRPEWNSVETYCRAWQIMRDGRLATGSWTFCLVTLNFFSTCTAWVGFLCQPSLLRKDSLAVGQSTKNVGNTVSQLGLCCLHTNNSFFGSRWRRPQLIVTHQKSVVTVRPET